MQRFLVSFPPALLPLVAPTLINHLASGKRRKKLVDWITKQRDGIIKQISRFCDWDGIAVTPAQFTNLSPSRSRRLHIVIQWPLSLSPHFLNFNIDTSHISCCDVVATRLCLAVCPFLPTLCTSADTSDMCIFHLY